MKQESPKWEKVKNEQNKAYHLFCIYRDLGPFRSIDKVVQKLDEDGTPLTRTQVGNYSSKWRWVERAEAYDDYRDEMQREANEEAVVEMNRRQAEEYKGLQGAVLNTMGRMDEEPEDPKAKPLTPNRAAYFLDACSRAYDRAAKGERLARGETTERTEESQNVKHTGQVDVNLQDRMERLKRIEAKHVNSGRAGDSAVTDAGSGSKGDSSDPAG